jgi:hypothetical protein
MERGVIAYKVLDTGGVAPFTRFRWPEGQWVEAGTVEPCRSGIHACRPSDLPYWLGPELWQIELEGDVMERERKVIGRRGRLVRRIPEWNGELLRAFTASCRAETKLRVGSIPPLNGYVGDIDRFRSQDRHGLAAFAAARAAELSGGRGAYERERTRQAAWLAERLGLGEA